MSAATDVLKQHKRLQQELRNAETAYADGLRQHARLEQALRHAEATRLQAYEAKATSRTSAAADAVEEAEQERSRIASELDRAMASTEGAHLARKATEDKIKALIETHVNVFIDVATQFSKHCEGERASFEESAHAWYAAHAAARAAWRPLTMPLANALERADAAIGELHDRGLSVRLSQVPTLPGHLATPEALFNAIPPARPPALEHMRQRQQQSEEVTNAAS